MTRVFFLISGVLLLLAGTLPVHAQTPAAENAAPVVLLQKQAASHPERVVLAYYKKADVKPDFAQWAALSPFLDEAKDADIAAIINRETNRLSRAYTEFNLEDPLVVHTHINLDDYSTINGVLNFNEFSPATFFSYSLYGENIAIVPRDIKNFGTMPMTREKMDEMLGKSQGSRLLAEVLLKPTLADMQAPFVQDKISYKLLLADIAEIRFWTPSSSDPELLWTWRADWYQPKTDENLLNLKPGEAP